MAYRIENIELFVRETPPGRVAFALGRQKVQRAKPTTNPLGHVRLTLRGGAFGCSGDRLSVRWLDKRPGRTHDQKLRELVDLVYRAADIYRQRPEFDSPFAKWRDCHSQIMQAGRDAGQEDLTSSFASALMERALLDAVSRAEGKPLFEMIHQDRLGIVPGAVHPELRGCRGSDILPSHPRTRFFIRHTVGLADPIRRTDLPDDQRVNDGLPETLEEYIAVDGVRYFKVKIAGDPQRDIQRLGRLWDILPMGDDTAVTLDANEAYLDLAQFESFVKSLRRELPGLFDHLLYIEQPLPRRLTFDAKSAPYIRRIAELKPLLIDEADGDLTAFKHSRRLGYTGASHKNCKGFFKSLLNKALCAHYAKHDEHAFLSAEDLQNLPVVPLQQDFVSLSILDLKHCERNGHHYNHGLAFLSEQDRANATRRHPDMYVRRGGEWFLNIRDGAVQCASLQCAGFGVYDEPDWASMRDMRDWLRTR